MQARLVAPLGTRDDLLHALEAVAEQAATMQRVGAAFRLGYLQGTSRFIHHVHVRALLNDFLLNYADLVRQWSERSIATVRGWDDLTSDGKEEAALRTIEGLPTSGTPSTRGQKPDCERATRCTI